VVARVTAYGLDGPWGGRPGWEQTAQAAVGLQVAYGGEPRPELIPIAATDLSTGLAAAFGAVAGLYARARGAAPPTVTTGLTRTAAWLAHEPAVRLDGRQWVGEGVRAPRQTLRAALEARSMVRRSGEVTEVAAPWAGEGLARFAHPAAPEVRSPGRARWIAGQALWAAYLASRGG
jgi:hypothetical protein